MAQFTAQKNTAGLNEDAGEQNHNLSLSHGLPPEVLSEIFILAIPTRNIRTFQNFPVEVPDYKTTFALSQTCNYWRIVALATPHIWSSISIVRPGWLLCRTGLMDYIRMFLDRSKNVPLHITIDIGYETQQWCRVFPCITTLFHPIFSQAYRWKSAIIRFEGISLEKFPRLYLPILESLNYRHVYPYMNYSKSIIEDTPSLRHVILDGPGSQIPLPWSRLLSYVGCPENLEIMRPASSQLRTCSFHGSISGPRLGMRRPSSPIVFSKLTCLRFINRNPQFPYSTENLFRWIVTPVLENLEIHSLSKTEASEIVVDLLRTTFPRPSTTLQSLSLHVGGMTGQDIKKLLYSTPCLTTLDICNTPASVFACLLVTAAQLSDLTGPLAPSLQSLTIHNFSHSDATALLAIYDSRHPPLNTTQDYKGIVRLDIILPYRSFRACHRAQRRIAEEGGMDTKASRLDKILGWCSHLVKQLLIDFPEKKKKYVVRREDYHRALIHYLNSPFYRYLVPRQVLDAW